MVFNDDIVIVFVGCYWEDGVFWVYVCLFVNVGVNVFIDYMEVYCCGCVDKFDDDFWIVCFGYLY